MGVSLGLAVGILNPGILNSGKLNPGVGKGVETRGSAIWQQASYAIIHQSDPVSKLEAALIISPHVV